jgi:hypothetical protein
LAARFSFFGIESVLFSGKITISLNRMPLPSVTAIAVPPEKGVPSSAKRKIFPPSIVG